MLFLPKSEQQIDRGSCCNMMLNMKKKRSISEEDVSLLLQRYTASTILALLQEVARFDGVKIDWNTLIKKTSTGISSAREYQMLWRHLAYHDILAEKLEDGAEPLDDDSDLEIEVEAFPVVSSEAATESAACVKVLIASGMPGDSCPTNHSTVEAALTINIPNNDQASLALSDNPLAANPAPGMNITIPVSVQKQPLPAAEGLDGNGSASAGLPARRKRKLWSAEEDMELIAAVQKCGEGNWANILKGDFKHDRTASQLSQRWAIIRKRQANSKSSNAGNSNSSVLSEAQLAARQAVSIALNMPMGNLASTSMAAATSSTLGTSKFSSMPMEAAPVSAPQTETRTSSLVGNSQPLQQPPNTPNPGIPQRGTANPAAKSRPTPKKLLVPTRPNPLVQAAAVAAGARIAPASTAVSLFKAAHSRNAVHIRQGGASLAKSTVTGGTKQPNANLAGPRPPNVHYIRTGLTSSSPPVYSGTVPSVQRSSGQQAQSSSGRPIAASQALPSGPSTSSNPRPQQPVLDSSCVGSPQGNAEMDLVAKSDSSSDNAGSAIGVGDFVVEGDGSEDQTKLDSSSGEARELIHEQPCLLDMEAVENQSVVEKTVKNQNMVKNDGDNPTVIEKGGDSQTVVENASE